MGRIFVSAPLPGDATARLSASHDVVIGEAGIGIAADAFARDVATFDAIVAMLTDRIDTALLARAPKLRIVANVAVGVDNVDLEACRARNVAVTNTPGVLTEASADLAFALLLAAARRIPEADRFVRAGAFTHWAPTLMIGKRVHGATLGIIGMGRIGQAVARRARGFGMHVLYNQRNALAPELDRALGATFAPLDAIFASSDFLSLHCPLTADTRHIVSRERLAQMRVGAILVNTARGPCVDEAALADALVHGPLAAAALDVFEDEPRIHPALLTLSNVVLAPHIGSADAPTRHAMSSMAIESVMAILDGRATANRVV